MSPSTPLPDFPEIDSASLFEKLLWLMKLRLRVRVNGASMLPTLPEGEIVLADPFAFRRRAPQVGDIVLARHPYRTDLLLIKRITAVTSAGFVHLRGDNPESIASTDSRAFGAVRAEALRGKVTAVWR